MDLVKIVESVFEDLALVAASNPNERLPKEEQLRCRIYATLQPLYKVVCAERGYTSVDEQGRTECDLWALPADGAPVWIEVKRCWSVRQWVNKPPEQLGAWKSDLGKLNKLPADSERYFLLFGCFDFDPLDEAAARDGVVQNIRQLHSGRQVHRASSRLQWRKNDGIAWAGGWVWRWRPGQTIEGL